MLLDELIEQPRRHAGPLGGLHVGAGRRQFPVHGIVGDQGFLTPTNDRDVVVTDVNPYRLRLAKQMGPGHTIVTILADYGQRYQSKMFNPEFLRERNLPLPDWLT